MPNNDSHQHVVKTSAQWNDRAIEYWVVPRGCLCVELTSRGKTKLKVGEGNKYYAQLPYICDIEDLSDYYTKEEINNLFNNLNRMAIMSTEEYDEKSDLPLTGNKLGDVRFVKSSSPSLKPDPDIYLWNGHKWIFVGYDIIDIDLSQYIKREKFEPVAAKVDEMYPKMHTHENKETLDRIEEPYTTAEKDKLDSLENYDDTEIRALIRQATHVHPNKSILDQIQQPFKNEDKTKLDSLENYDDTELRDRISDVEAVAHTHSNKDELDSIYSGFVDEHQVLVEFKTVVEEEIDDLNNDVADLKTKIHTHSNKNILDSTTAPYTTQDKATLDELAAITIFDGASPTYDGFRGYVPAPVAGQQSYFLRGDGTWAKVKGGDGDKYKAGDGIYILSDEVISDTFPLEIFAKSSRTSQYVIYGSADGVGEWDGTNYVLSITVEAEGEETLTTQVLYNARLYTGDYIDYSRQIIHHAKEDMRQYITLYDDPTYGTSGTIQGKTGQIAGNYNYNPGVTNYIEVTPGEIYWVKAFPDEYIYFDNSYHCIFDENYNVTRYFAAKGAGAMTIEIQPGEKYARFVGKPSYGMLNPGFLYRMTPYEEPCVLPSIVLYPNKINTIDVANTNKPSEIYIEAVTDEPDDPDDPMSKYNGIIYNEGVLDIAQEHPDSLNKLTVHFRETEKVITLPEGNKYKSGDGIYILAGDASSTTLPVEIYAKANKLKQYVLYGGTNPVGDWDSSVSKYVIPIKVSAEGMSDISTSVMLDDPIGNGDYIDYANQQFVHTRTNMTFGVRSGEWGRWINVDGGVLNWSQDRMAPSDYIAVSPGYVYLYYPGDMHGCDQFDIPCYAALYDENKVFTRSIRLKSFTEVTIEAQPGEAYLRVSYGYYQGSSYKLTKIGEVVTPIVLPPVVIYANKINTIDVMTTNKPAEIYVETAVNSGSEDPMADITGLIYNDGVLDITQEDPNALNELTIHFRESDKVITVPAGGGGGDSYAEGQGIEFTSDPRSAELPNTYQQIEYLQGTGTQGIVLNYTPMSTTPADIKYELTYSDLVSEPTGWHYLIGGWLESSHKMPPSIVYSNNNYQDKLVLSICESDIITDGDWPTGNDVHTSIVTIDGSTAKMQLDNGTESSGTWSGSIDHAPAIFASNRGSGTLGSFSAYKFRELKIYENGILIHHYYPCYRKSDNEPGIYDVITNTFLTNNGTGDFICGNDVNYDDTFINAKLGNGLSFDNNDAITVDEMTGASALTDGTSGTVPAPSAGDENKFLSGSGTWQTVSGGTQYQAGQGIEIEPVPELIDQHFDYTAYINTVQGVEYGSIVKNNNDSFTITATANGAYTYPYNSGHGALYTMPVEPNTKYRLTMDLSDWTVDSYVDVFRNQTTLGWRADMPGDPYLEFTTESNTTEIAFRFGVTYSGHTQTFSNIKVYQVSESTTTDSISAKLGSGLRFDTNNAIEAIPYALPIASDQTLGGIRVGNNLTIDPETGVLNATGDDTVYEAGAGIDIQQGRYETYRVVGYFQSDGSQTVDTGYCKTVANGSMNFEIKWRLVSTPTATAHVLSTHDVGASEDIGSVYIGVSKGTSMSEYKPAGGIITSSDGYSYFQYDSSGTATSTRSDIAGFDNDGDISFNVGGLYSIDTGATWRNVFLYDSTPAVIYFCRIFDDDVLVCDLVPCIREEDNAQGFYDRVREIFIENTGTAFTMGQETGEVISRFVHESESDPYEITNTGIIEASYSKQDLELTLRNRNETIVVPVSDTQYTAGDNIVVTGQQESFTLLQYIRGKGNQTINTHKRITSQEGKFEYAFQMKNSLSTSQNGRNEAIICGEYMREGTPFIGIAKSNDNTVGSIAGIVKDSNGSLSWYWITRGNTTTLAEGSMEYHSNGSVTKDGATYTTEWPIINDSEIYIFGNRDFKSCCDLYYVKIYDNNVLIFDGIPVRRNSDGEIGLFDRVDNTFYMNDLGGGSFGFVAGPDVSGADPILGDYIGTTKTISATVGVTSVTQDSQNQNTLHVTTNGVTTDITIPDYTLPIASDQMLGGVKVGDGLEIDEEGVLSAKIGTGLTFDSNNAIELDNSIKLRLNCTNNPN